MTDNEMKPHPLKGRPSPLKGRPSPLKGRTFPNLWVTGTDPVRRKMYRKFLLARCQARYRNERWDCTFEQWEQLLKGNEHLLGRKAGMLRIKMKNPTLGWEINNMCLATQKTK